MSVQETKPWVAIALLLRPQGRRGELLCEPLCDLPEVFAVGHTVALAPVGSTVPAPDALRAVLEEHWLPTGKNAGRIVLKLSGCDSISQAESIAGRVALLPPASLPELAPDTFFVGDLLGCELYDGDTLAGRIVDVQFATGPDGRTRLEDAAPLLGIERVGLPATDSAPAEAPEPILVPFVRAWLDSVDIPARRIVMHLPPGLLDGDDLD